MAKTQEEFEWRLQVLRDIFGQWPPQPTALKPTDEVGEQQEEDEERDDGDEQPPPVIRDPNLVSPVELYHAEQRRKQQARNAHMHQGMASAVDADDDSPFLFGEHKGQHAPLGVRLVPFGAVARYCYNSVPSAWLQPLATEFFDKNQIYNRGWEFYYTPPSVFSDATPFVAEHQLQALILEINNLFPEANILLRQDVVIDFDDLPQHLRPRFAGNATSRAQYSSLVDQISREPMVSPDSGDRSVEAFKAKMQAAADAHKAKGKKARAAKKQDSMVKRQGMVKETLRAQRYLGLLGKLDDSLLPEISNLTITPLDVTKACPFPFTDEPIFVAIDVEAYERPPRMVTEVGIATLDTRDLRGHAPEDIGKNWHQHIRGRHFRVIEYKELVNHEFIQGCPGSFEFGDSEFVSKDTMASVLASCFREPFGKKMEDDEGEENHVDTLVAEPEKRNIVLVGHDLSQDISYCHDIGFSVLNRGNILDSIDTVNLHRTFTKDPSARSLGSIINDFDMTGWHLHNAGNDAVYTLHAMLAISVKLASSRGDEDAAKKMQENLEQRVDAQVESARDRAQADSEGWNLPEDEGGVSLPSTGDSHFRFHTIGGAPLDV